MHIKAKVRNVDSQRPHSREHLIFVANDIEIFLHARNIGIACVLCQYDQQCGMGNEGSGYYVLTLLVFRFLLKYDRLAHVRMKKSILSINHRCSGVRSSESQRISRMRRLKDFFSSNDPPGVVSLVPCCGSVFATTELMSLSEDIIVGIDV